MQTNNEHVNGVSYRISDFVEQDSSKQAEMEKSLRDFKLEDIESPVYFIFNVNAAIIGL
ncbi:MAG: hypothetical protein Q4B45_09455 [Coriobacteriia bacterium]|nr:hypothetical protein [Coriobacteriia bacterium]